MKIPASAPRPRADLLVQQLGVDERVVLDLESGSFFGFVGLAARLWDGLWTGEAGVAEAALEGTVDRAEVEKFLQCLERAGLLSGALPPSAYPPEDSPARPWLEGDEVTRFMASGRSQREACLLRHGDIRSLTLGPSAGVGESGNPLVFRS
ncbi:MAG: PqqD family protein [Acidobacteriota bacterium]